MLSKKVFNFIKTKIPKISQTELIALTSGNTSIDRSILLGKVKLPEKIHYKNKLNDDKLNQLLNKFPVGTKGHKVINIDDNKQTSKSSK